MIRKMNKADWSSVKAIYIKGILTNNATFEQVENVNDEYESWYSKKLSGSTFVFVKEKKVLGWSALSGVSDRCVYTGVAEVSVYVDQATQGLGIGTLLLQQLINWSEATGIWTLQAGIFPENIASIRLHEKLGFEVLGIRKKLGKLNGVWRDVAFLERRSEVVI